jgi:hypothetical protein
MILLSPRFQAISNCCPPRGSYCAIGGLTWRVAQPPSNSCNATTSDRAAREKVISLFSIEVQLAARDISSSIFRDRAIHSALMSGSLDASVC